MYYNRILEYEILHCLANKFWPLNFLCWSRSTTVEYSILLSILPVSQSLRPLVSPPQNQGLPGRRCGPLGGGFGDFLAAELSIGANTTIIAAAVKAAYLPTFTIASFLVIFTSLPDALWLFFNSYYKIGCRYLSLPSGDYWYICSLIN